jgi:hypothetical protein
MAHEPIETDSEGLAEIWQSAERRRAEDLSGWLSQMFGQRPRPKVADSEGTYVPGYPVLR